MSTKTKGRLDDFVSVSVVVPLDCFLTNTNFTVFGCFFSDIKLSVNVLLGGFVTCMNLSVYTLLGCFVAYIKPILDIARFWRLPRAVGK